MGLRAEGQKGEKGARGLQGLPGSQGPYPATGNTTIIGPPGMKGDRGLDGEKGEQGWRGPLGPKGDRGRDGLYGQKGEKGLPGVPGPRVRSICSKTINFTKINTFHALLTIGWSLGTRGPIWTARSDGAEGRPGQQRLRRSAWSGRTWLVALAYAATLFTFVQSNKLTRMF